MSDFLSPARVAALQAAPREQAQQFFGQVWYADPPCWPLVAELGRKDRFFLLTYLLNRRDADRDWLYARCREVEADPDGFLDLWAREHYKSTIITFAGVIQEIVRDPEVTVGIFSHTRPVAKSFLIQIKTELETNKRLQLAYPQIFYANPAKDARSWSEEKGIVVKRTGNPKEATVEANGLVEGMPTGRHYRLRVYDDVVTQESVTTPEQMQKTTQAWELSGFLGQAEGGRDWYIGTRYHFNDTYRTMLERGSVVPRVHPATDDGTPSGSPVLLSREALDKQRRDKGSYVFACQMLLNPVADDAQGFKREWLKFYETAVDHKSMNRYILVDPANEKKPNSDFSVFWVLGLAGDGNIYVIDCVRERVNLTERADTIFDLHRRYKPRAVGYEKYGKDSDIQHFADRMSRDNYRFAITALGGGVKKEDRIRRLVPYFEQGRVWLPEIMIRDSDGRKTDLVKHFIENEYLAFPVAVHDDMLDAMARILDPELFAIWPKEDDGFYAKREERKARYEIRPRGHGATWMSV